MGETKAAIKYCGSCNPWVDLAEIGREIGSLLTARGIVVCDPYADALDSIVVLNGCPRACADRPEVWQQARTHLTLSGDVLSVRLARGTTAPELAQQIVEALSDLEEAAL